MTAASRRQHLEGKALLQVKLDRCARMAEIADGNVLTDMQFKISTAGREHKPAFDGRCPDDPAVNNALNMVEDRITIIASAARGSISFRPQDKGVRTAIAPLSSQPQFVHRVRYGVRIGFHASRKCHNWVACTFTNPLNPGSGIAAEDRMAFRKARSYGPLL